MDLFIFPSLFEGLGMVLIEAQINGLQCIVSDFVPREVNVSDRVVFLPINNNFEEWAKVLSNCDFKRYNEINKIKNSGYDIKETARKIQEKYINLEKEVR